MNICKVPIHIIQPLRDLFPIEKGECFRNSGIATILSTSSYDYSNIIRGNSITIEYGLGFLTPPGYETVPHAWLNVTKNGISKYWDHTLQLNSPLWNKSCEKFVYKLSHKMSADELLSLLEEKYSEREFTCDGIPHGEFRFPIISESGVIY